jgi:hypothetical protein
VLTFYGKEVVKNHQFSELKLDMMKDYDRIELKYLEAIMTWLGFNR